MRLSIKNVIYICYELGFLQAVSDEYLSKHNKMHWSLLETVCWFLLGEIHLLDLKAIDEDNCRN